MKKRTIGVLTGIAVVAAVGAGLATALTRTPERAITPATNQPSTPTPKTSTVQPDPGFDKNRFSITDSSSLWVIANKKRPLEKGYAPQRLVAPKIPLRLAASHEQMKVSDVISADLERMVAVATQDGMNLMLSSGYRSEALQTQFYNDYVARDGQTAADRYSARPGTSEHQTGLAVDMIRVDDKCHLEVCFAALPEGKWLAAHAHEYGFIVRYRDGKEAETTYQYEPWHLRYVGKELASELYQSGQTMEAFFGALN